MNLAIFDIDGTLTNTTHVDALCFIQAFATSHAITEIDTDWTKYSYTTDSGIALQILHEKFGRAPDTEELEKFKHCFISLLKKNYLADLKHFVEIPGASALLKRFREEAGWAIAIASGCWQESANLKLEAAGIEINDLPPVFADEFVSREEIVQTAICKARTHYHQKGFARKVSIGDGLWDVRAALQLGIPFLGIGSGERAAALREAGVSHILKDFRDYNRFIRFVTEVKIPKPKMQII